MGLAYLRSDVEGPDLAFCPELRPWKRLKESVLYFSRDRRPAFETESQTIIIGPRVEPHGLAQIAMAKSISKDWKPAVLYEQDRN
jgi:hypothetical protein